MKRTMSRPYAPKISWQFSRLWRYGAAFFILFMAFMPKSHAYTDIVEAAKQGDLKAVENFVRQGAPVNMVGGNGYHALDWAAGNGYLEIAKILLNAHADPNLKKDNNWTPLIRAAENNHPDIIPLLLAAGAEINAQNNQGKTALFVAAAAGNTQIVKILLDKGAGINATNHEGMTPLMAAVKNQKHETVKLLLKYKPNLNLRDQVFNDTALVFAVTNGDMENVQMLVAAGADIEIKCNNGKTAFMIAAEQSKITLMEFLQKRRANINAIDADGRSAFYTATTNGDEMVKAWLIKAKAIQK